MDTGAESGEMGLRAVRWEAAVYLVWEVSSGSHDEHSSKPPRMHLILLNHTLKTG